MTTLLFELPLGRKRDVVTARQRARQVAALLGYNSPEQTRIASAVFELARQTLQQTDRAVLYFEVTEQTLLVVPHEDATRFGSEGPPLLRLEQPLPCGESAVAPEDLPWVAQQLVRLTPVNTFEEIQRVNQELLRALLELQACKERLAELTAPQLAPSAA